MRIKLLKKCIVGKKPDPVKANSVVECDDAEAKALIAVGYAKETTEKTDAEKAAAKSDNKDAAAKIDNKAK